MGVKRVPVIVVALIGLIAASCSKSSNNATTTPSAGATSTSKAATYTVNVDGKNPSITETFTAYYPATVTVHPGDTINFPLIDNGEPHTVTLGTLANTAVTQAQANPNSQQPPAGDAALPQVLPVTPDGDPVIPVPQVTQIAADPCVIASGAVPTSTSATCPSATTTAQPAFDGTQAFYNSGLLSSDTSYSVKLASTIQPGTYRYMCLIHREGMSGEIVVVPAAQAVTATAAAQEAVGAQDLTKDIAALQPAVGPLAEGKNPELGFLPLGPKTLLAGDGTMEANAGSIDAFGPPAITATVGSTLSWFVLGDHTITFNAPDNANDIRVAGTNRLNLTAVQPAGGAGEPNGPPAAGPRNGPPPVVKINGGSFDGTGFHSSGVIFSFFNPLYEYQLTFTKKGTYPYQCLIHDGMRGTVVIQ